MKDKITIKDLLPGDLVLFKAALHTPIYTTPVVSNNTKFLGELNEDNEELLMIISICDPYTARCYVSAYVVSCTGKVGWIEIGDEEIIEVTRK